MFGIQFPGLGRPFEPTSIPSGAGGSGGIDSGSDKDSNASAANYKSSDTVSNKIAEESHGKTG